MRGRGPGLVLPLLLLLPPAANILWDAHRGRAGRAQMALLGTTPADPSLRLEVSALKQEIWERRRELQLLRGWTESQPRHVPILAEAIHIPDLSPRRSGFWVWAEALDGVTPRTSVAYRGALVGSVDQVFRGQGVARVRTLLDPYFRVRFRYKEASGFLWGTGRADSEGRPLLKILHLDVEVAFHEGEQVHTEGGDGRFPRGLPIGDLVRSGTAADPRGDGRGDLPGGAGFLVRGEYRLDALTEVVLLVDRAEVEARSAVGKAEAE